jgi:ATP-binding cassette subfamily B protein
LRPARTFSPKSLSNSIPGRFLSLVRPHRRLLAQAVLGAACYALLGLSSTIFVQKLIDHVLVDGNRNLLNLLGVVMVALLFIQTFIGATKNFYTLRTGQSIDAALIMGYYRHLLRLPQSFFDSMRVGEMISRVNDAVKVRAFLNDVAIDLIANVLIVVFSFSLMLLYSWRLAVVVASMLPVMAGVYWLANRANRTIRRRLMEQAADLESQLVESLQSAATIKRFSLEETSEAAVERRLVRLLRSVYHGGQVSVFSGGGAEVATRAMGVLVLWIGGMFVLDRGLTPGQMMSFYALVGYLSGPAAALVSTNRTLQDALIASDRLFDIMDLESEESGRGGIDLEPRLVGDIRFEGVSFRYGARASVLKDLNLSVVRGSLTAIVGESGSGKSTLAALLQKLYPLTNGRIRIGDIDLANLTSASVRSLIVAVPQDIHILTGSVLENIAFGDPAPDMLRVVAISEELGLSEFVERLPAGFQTRLGQHGANLSAGERQRLAIARALYRNPEILVLDEPTASLDTRSESYVRRAINRLRMEGRTVILIAHRLPTVIDADAIAVLHQGCVAEVGNHQELMGRRGRYFELWRQQLSADAGESEFAAA